MRELAEKPRQKEVTDVKKIAAKMRAEAAKKSSELWEASRAEPKKIKKAPKTKKDDVIVISDSEDSEDF